MNGTVFGRKVARGSLLSAMAVIVIASGMSFAAVPGTRTGTITTCYGKTGALKVIDAQAGKTCGKAKTLTLASRPRRRRPSNVVAHAVGGSQISSTSATAYPLTHDGWTQGKKEFDVMVLMTVVADVPADCATGLLGVTLKIDGASVGGPSVNGSDGTGNDRHSRAVNNNIAFVAPGIPTPHQMTAELMEAGPCANSAHFTVKSFNAWVIGLR